MEVLAWILTGYAARPPKKISTLSQGGYVFGSFCMCVRRFVMLEVLNELWSNIVDV